MQAWEIKSKVDAFHRENVWFFYWCFIECVLVYCFNWLACYVSSFYHSSPKYSDTLVYPLEIMAPDKAIFSTKIVHIFFLFCTKHMFWVLIRSASSRCFKWVPTTYVLWRNKKNTSRYSFLSGPILKSLNGIDTFSWEIQLCQFVVCFPFWKEVYSKRKEFAPHGSKFFPFTIDPFSEGTGCRKANRKSQKLSYLYEIARNWAGVSSSLNKLL